MSDDPQSFAGKLQEYRGNQYLPWVRGALATGRNRLHIVESGLVLSRHVVDINRARCALIKRQPAKQPAKSVYMRPLFTLR